MANKRNSIVELFRLFSMWCVVAHHFVIHNADPVSVFGNAFTRVVFNCIFFPVGKVAVGCFVFITVWFIASRSAFSVRDAVDKIAALNSEVVFYSVVLSVISVYTGYSRLSVSLVIDALFPIITGYGWWFATSYAALIVLLPFLIKGLCACNKREHGVLALGLTIAFGFFRYLPFVSFPAGGMLVDFIVIAVDICFVRWHINLDSLRIKRLLLACSMCFAIGAIFYYVQFHSQGIIHDFAVNFFNGYVGSSANLLSLGASIFFSLAFFKLAKQYQWSSSLVNRLAGSAFAVYLISDFAFVRDWLWKNVFTFDHLGNHFGLFFVTAIPSLVMVCVLIIDLARRTVVVFFRSHRYVITNRIAG